MKNIARFLLLILGVSCFLYGNETLEDYPRIHEKIARLDEQLQLSEEQKERITQHLLDGEDRIDSARTDADSDEEVIKAFHESEITTNELVLSELQENQKEPFLKIIQPELDMDKRMETFKSAIMLTPEQTALISKILPAPRKRGPEGRRGGNGQSRQERGGRDPERRQKMMAQRQERAEKIEMLLTPEQQLLFRDFEQKRMEQMQQRRANRQ